MVISDIELQINKLLCSVSARLNDKFVHIFLLIHLGLILGHRRLSKSFTNKYAPLHYFKFKLCHEIFSLKRSNKYTSFMHLLSLQVSLSGEHGVLTQLGDTLV